MATRIIDDSKLQDIAVAIQAKDNGGQMTVDEMAGRIENIPSGSDFDMTVTDNQVKMIIEVDSFDLSFWTRFGISGGGTVTVDWGDGTSDSYIGDSTLEYAPQRKHDYQEAGRYRVTETVENGILTTGSIGDYSVLSEGPVNGHINNNNETLRRMYNYKLKALAYGDNIEISRGFNNIPCFNLFSGVENFGLFHTTVNSISIKNGVTEIAAYNFNSASAYDIKIPASVTKISNYAFLNSIIRVIDFTDFQLNENNELPITFASSNIFNGTSPSMILLFATQEIAEVAKTTTNLSQLAAQIKYVGEV